MSPENAATLKSAHPPVMNMNLCFCIIFSEFYKLKHRKALGHFPFNPKFWKFLLVHKMEWTISVWSDRNIQDQL